jgi:GH15 family glucan-1,4-alpha-glucosidase
MSGIDDYAIIGDCRSAALVSRSGSIDWLCWPRFDSPSLFGGILDPRGGAWSIAPRAGYASRRAYVDGTNVLRTVFETETGRATLTDLMTVTSEEDKRRLLLPEHEVLRLLFCERGEIDVEMIFAPRPDYGRMAPLRDDGKLGVAVQVAGGIAILCSEAQVRVGGDGVARAAVHLRAGESMCASLVFAREGPAGRAASATKARTGTR